jgi:hypothetical protein
MSPTLRGLPFSAPEPLRLPMEQTRGSFRRERIPIYAGLKLFLVSQFPKPCRFTTSLGGTFRGNWERSMLQLKPPKEIFQDAV